MNPSLLSTALAALFCAHAAAINQIKVLETIKEGKTIYTATTR